MNQTESLIRNFPYQILLGSASPRRQELLKSLGYNYTVRSIRADESNWPQNLRAQEIAIYLADLKSSSYDGTLLENELLITADTIVWCDGKIFNKPADFEEGKRMLAALSGKMHEVFTAVCLRDKNKRVTFFDTSKVYFKELRADEIEYYLNNFNPYDKAGGYGVQDWIGYIAIEKIEGSFYNVMGLPVKLLHEELMRF